MWELVPGQTYFQCRMRGLREAEKSQRKEKKYEEYDWLDLVLRSKLNKLMVQELNKYITKHKLNMRGNKPDKVNAITADVL